jgi:excisionase family DNA binding protein
MTDVLIDIVTQAVRAEIAQSEARIVAQVGAMLAERNQSEGLSPAAFAKRKGVSACTVYRKLRSGEIAHTRIGSRIVIPADACTPRTSDEIAQLVRQARQP